MDKINPMRVLVCTLLISGLFLSSARAAFEDSPFVIQKDQEGLQKEMRPDAGLLFNALADEGDYQVIQGGAEGQLWLNPSLPLGLKVLWGDFSQEDRPADGSNDFERIALNLFTRDFRIEPWFSIKAEGTLEFFDNEDELFGGTVAAQYRQDNGSTWTVSGLSESFWSHQDLRDPRQFPRISNLALIEETDSINGVAGAMDLVTLEEHRLFAKVEYNEYEQDDNQQFQAYAHYQFPLLDSQKGKWTVLRPNVYYEAFDDISPAYFSPEFNLSIGLSAHTVREWNNNRLELEVNPQLIFRDEEELDRGDDTEDEQGIMGVVDYTRLVGDWRLGGGVMGYAETTDYWVWRVSLACSRSF